MRKSSELKKVPKKVIGVFIRKPVAKALAKVVEYGGKEVYASKKAQMKHEKAEPPKKEASERTPGKQSTKAILNPKKVKPMK